MRERCKIFDIYINGYMEHEKPRIAMGLQYPEKVIIENLRMAREYAHITLVGPPAIKDIEGFCIEIAEVPEERLVSMLCEKEVEGIVRGTVDDLKTYELYRARTGQKNAANPGVLEIPRGHQFMLSPLSNPEGWGKEERYEIALAISEFMSSHNLKIKMAVFTGVRHGTYGRRVNIRDGVVGTLNKTYEDAEWIVHSLAKVGHDSQNYAIDLNRAIEDGCNVLIPVNGMVGNQIFRAVLFCGGKVLATPRLGLPHCYEDNSRTEKDFVPHIKWLVASINRGKKQGKKPDAVVR